MKNDGYILLAINDKPYNSNESKQEILEKNFIDIRLYHADFIDSDIAEQVTGQLPKGLTNALVLCTIHYRSEECGNPYDGIEYEDTFEVVNHIVMDFNYKETYRRNVTEELSVGISGYAQLECMPDGPNYYKELVGDWEEFYDEDFVPTPNGKAEQVIKIGNTILGVDWGLNGDKSVMVKAKKNKDGTLTFTDIKELK